MEILAQNLQKVIKVGLIFQWSGLNKNNVTQCAIGKQEITALTSHVAANLVRPMFY